MVYHYRAVDDSGTLTASTPLDTVEPQWGRILDLKTVDDEFEVATEAAGCVIEGPHPPSTPVHAARWQIVVALISIYLVWGSTYLAVRYALAGFPPFLLGGIRFLTAGLLLFGFLMARGGTLPTRREVIGAGIVGALLMGIGNGGVVYA